MQIDEKNGAELISVNRTLDALERAIGINRSVMVVYKETANHQTCLLQELTSIAGKSLQRK